MTANSILPPSFDADDFTAKQQGEAVLPDVADLADAGADLAGFDACFFCLGISAVGMSEERYTQLTYGLTLTVAQVLARLNPGMTFVYVSGAGTDSSERGRAMWELREDISRLGLSRSSHFLDLGCRSV